MPPCGWSPPAGTRATGSPLDPPLPHTGPLCLSVPSEEGRSWRARTTPPGEKACGGKSAAAACDAVFCSWGSWDPRTPSDTGCHDSVRFLRKLRRPARDEAPRYLSAMDLVTWAQALPWEGASPAALRPGGSRRRVLCPSQGREPTGIAADSSGSFWSAPAHRMGAWPRPRGCVRGSLGAWACRTGRLGPGPALPSAGEVASGHRRSLRLPQFPHLQYGDGGTHQRAG